MTWGFGSARLYARPRRVTRLDACAFFHTMDLPGHGVVRGLWDLRGTVDAYLGHPDLAGKRVLDVGTASGYLTFEMERRGAEVVSVDAARWEEVPYPRSSAERAARECDLAAALEQIKNGYWLAHRALGSRARVHYGDAGALPAALGSFDVAVMGMLLGHLRDPMGALASVARLGPRCLIVTEGLVDDERPVGHFGPDGAAREPTNVWWSLSPACIARMLSVFGFEAEVRRARHLCLHAPDSVAHALPAGREVEIATVVGRRS